MAVWAVDRGLLSPATPRAQTEGRGVCRGNFPWHEHRIMEWLGMEGTLNAISFHPFRLRLPHTPSSLALDVLSRLLGRFDRQETK